VTTTRTERLFDLYKIYVLVGSAGISRSQLRRPAPRLTRADAARALGAELARLEDTLAGRAQEIQDHHPERTRLTAEQTAAVLSVLTDGKRASAINAPAGSTYPLLPRTRNSHRARRPVL
jgi:hypothetical protein